MEEAALKWLIGVVQGARVGDEKEWEESMQDGS